MVNTARAMWTIFEPVHAVSYFHTRCRAAFEAAGLRGFWRGYFAGRAAPLGPVGPAPVVAAFYNFAPAMVARALPAVWELAPPAAALLARAEGAVDALAEITADTKADDVAEAADLLWSAASGIDSLADAGPAAGGGFAGRVLGAANAALPAPAEPLARLWHAATVLREHRGDGHVAALLTAGLDGVTALAWRAGIDLSADTLRPARGWTDDQWTAAVTRLADRGLLTPEGRATRGGLDLHRAVEETTDRLAAGPWDALGPERTARLRELLGPIAVACHATMPRINPIGLPAPVAP